MSKMKIGIYGGTFNPPHIGHYESVKAFSAEIKPDKLLIIPASIPPHKELCEDFPAEVRLKMCSEAFADIEGAEISDLEIKRKGKSYTYLTLEELCGECRELYFLLGTDMFITLDKWRFPEKIFKLCTVCLIRRESDGEITELIEEKKRLFEEDYKARIIEIKKDVIEISSSELRQRLRSGEDCSEYLSEGVLKFIKGGGYYS